MYILVLSCPVITEQMEPIVFSINGALMNVSNCLSVMLRLLVHQDGGRNW
jgi:hypothetical protein